MIADPHQTGLWLTVTTSPGLEGLLEEELAELGMHSLETGFGAVSLTGSWETAARILLWCRLGSRLLLKVAEFSAPNEAVLYSQVRRIDWPEWFSRGQTFSVRVNGDFGKTRMARSFAPLKIKDAVCDEFRKRTGGRPSVDRETPDVPIVAFFRDGRCQLSLDLAGQPMHRRGYREEGSVAPIKEHRAAALLRFLGYDGSRPFIDPFCGSGTLAIEAALIASNCPPGLLRRPDRFSVSRFSDRGRAALRALWALHESQPRAQPAQPVLGFDLEGNNVEIARTNARRAGFELGIHFGSADAREITAPGHDIACNPPYGERLDRLEGAIELVAAFARRVRSHCAGARLAMVLPHGPLTKCAGLRAERRLPVMSAPLELRFLKYSIFPERPGRGL
ncbi:MAG TPA: THUMP domain-containing protein [Verrucomicrobiales bacterium]|nr:THUMP domain-containing protein [Verrucomicrobiales bacterium]